MMNMDAAVARDALTTERRRIEEALDMLAAERADSLDASRTRSAQDIGELAEHITEQRDISVEADTLQRELDALDAALRRVDVGTYGRCVVCGRDIEPDRLAAMPAAARCADDQRAHERGQPGLSGGKQR